MLDFLGIGSDQLIESLLETLQMLITSAVIGAVIAMIIALILSIPGLIRSIVGVCKRNAKKGLDATGLAFNAVTVIFFFVVLGAISAFLS